MAAARSERIAPVTGDGSVHAFSPDGKWLVYAQIDATTQRDLWMIDSESAQKPQPLIVEPGDQANAVISPNGRWIAYHSSEIGEIYVRPFPNVADGRWQIVASGGKWPLWSRDGTELFYLTGPGISSVQVEPTPSFQWSSPKHLLDAAYVGFPGLAGPRNYDLSPDGKRFLVIKEGGREKPPADGRTGCRGKLVEELKSWHRQNDYGTGERATLRCQARLEFGRAIAVAAGPWLRPR